MVVQRNTFQLTATELGCKGAQCSILEKGERGTS